MVESAWLLQLLLHVHVACWALNAGCSCCQPQSMHPAAQLQHLLAVHTLASTEHAQATSFMLAGPLQAAPPVEAGDLACQVWVTMHVSSFPAGSASTWRRQWTA